MNAMNRLRRMVLLLGAAAMVCAAQAEAAGDDVALRIEAKTPALGPDGTLVEHIGFQTGADGMTPVLRAGKECPCTQTVSFSTAVDEQVEIPIVIMRGKTREASKSSLIAAVAVRGLEPLPAGYSHVRVKLAVAADGRLEVSARSAEKNTPLRVVKVGPAPAEYEPPQ